MVTFPIDQFDAAQQHQPQVGRWTIGDAIYVLEVPEDVEKLPIEPPAQE